MSGAKKKIIYIVSQLLFGCVFGFSCISVQAQYSSQNIKLIQSKAKSGDAKAQSALGFFYQQGTGVPKDSKRAIYWLKKAAAKGDKKAPTMLGIIYMKEKDYPKAFDWFKKGAKKGVPESQGLLGSVYLEGLPGIKPDYQEARYWLQQAADKGDVIAQSTLDKMSSTKPSI